MAMQMNGAVNGNASQFLFLPYTVYTHYWVFLQLHARYEDQCSTVQESKEWENIVK